MTPCPGCSRHVRDGELACPFCDSALATPRPRAPVVGRVTRAAVFSAALVACGGKHDDAKPAPHGSAEHLDQDFNQLLGSAEGSAQPGANDAGVAQVVADAAVAVDAGLSDEERTRQLQRAQEDEQRKKQQQQQQREIEDQRRVQQRDWHNVAKPYGAPPARRRIV